MPGFWVATVLSSALPYVGMPAHSNFPTVAVVPSFKFLSVPSGQCSGEAHRYLLHHEALSYASSKFLFDPSSEFPFNASSKDEEASHELDASSEFLRGLGREMAAFCRQISRQWGINCVTKFFRPPSMTNCL